MRRAAILTGLALAAADVAVPRAAFVNSIGNVGNIQNIRLEADLAIPAGRELFLPISIPPVSMAIQSNGPAKVNKVFSAHANGLFGVGEVIDVNVQFTSGVDVVGVPELKLKTGCHTSSCTVPEVQTFYCQATGGQFSISFNGQTVRNIPYNVTPMQLRDFLQRLSSIASVSISYDAGISACAFRGTNIRVTFNRVNFPGIDGNLPQLTTDPLNNGGNGNPLVHHTFPVVLSPVATEVQAGVCFIDRVATYLGYGAANNIIVFRYVVQNGDLTTTLDYTSTDALSLPSGAAIYNTGTFIPVNLKLPVPGRAPTWPTGVTSSLSLNSAIAVSSAIPTVVSISSSTPDGIYGVGQVIEILITMSLPVAYTGSPILILATGVNNANCPIIRVDGNGLILVAQYTVAAGDFSLDLTYVNTNSLQLIGASQIRRLSTTPTTNANLTLPANGLTGSLSVMKNLVIDTTSPYVISVTGQTSNGVYTVGDVIVLNVLYSRPVVVTGSPSFDVSTGSVDLFPGYFVQTVPTSGNSKLFTFPSQVDLGWLPVGFKLLIANQIFTVAQVNGFLVTMVESYVGTTVAINIDPLSPNLAIKTPGTQRAVYSGGSGTSTIQFSYVVLWGDTSATLATASNIVLNGGSILRQSTTPTTSANLVLPTPGATGSLNSNSQIAIDSTQPRVISVSTPNRNGVYGIGLSIIVQITFDLPVVFIGLGSPRVVLNTGIDRFAYYISGSGTTTLTFQLMTTTQDATPALAIASFDGLRLPSTLVSICRLSMAPFLRAKLTLPTIALGQIVIDPTAPTITSISVGTSANLFRPGDNLNLLVTFTEAVDVNGAPSLALNFGGRFAAYFAGTGTNVITFQYTVVYGDAISSANIASIYAINLNGGTIVSHASGSAACLVVPPTLGFDRPVIISSASIQVSSVYAVSTRGTYTVGATLTIAVAFSDPITVPGTPQLALNTGNPGGDQIAVFASSNKNIAYFTYTVQATDGISIVSQASVNALKCFNGNGLNINALKDSSNIGWALWTNQLVVYWIENLAVRVKLFNMNPQIPLWSTIDSGVGLNIDPTQAASGTNCVALNTQLICAWAEMNPTPQVNQIRVALYNGLQNAPAWNMLSVAGLNINLAKNAATPNLVSLNNKLYIAWSEVQANNQWSLNIFVWNGNVVAPSWLNVGSTLSLLATSDHQKAQFIVFQSQLILLWQQSTPTSSIIRAASYNGVDQTPIWQSLDGNTGLNVLATNLASSPCVIVCNGGLFAAWQEIASNGIPKIQVKAYNAQTWSAITAPSGLSSGLTISATQVSLSCVNNVLYATWQENSTPSTIRTAKYISSTTWNIDTGAGNDNSLNNAFAPKVSTGNSMMFLMWLEQPAGGNVQARVAVRDMQYQLWNSIVYTCIQRVGSNYNVPVAMVLPEVYSGFSLSDQSWIFIDTTTPIISDIRVINPPFGPISTADTSQTIAIVYSTSPIASGEFQLSYNGYSTTCIPYTAAATDIAAALNSISDLSLSVVVTEASNALLKGRLFQVNFNAPTVGMLPLTIGTNCLPLTCASGSVGSACAVVLINTERSSAPLQPGFIELLVSFTGPVQVIAGSTPKLTIATGAATTALVPYTIAFAVQTLDIGVTGTSQVLSGGYQIQYGASTSGCIDPLAADADITSLRSQLLTLPAVKMLGISNVSSIPMFNGWRTTISFASGTPLMLSPVIGACSPFAGAIQTIDIAANAAITAGGFRVGHGQVSPSSCLNFDASADDLRVAFVNLFNGVLAVGVTRQDFALSRRYTITFSDQALASQAIYVSTTGCTAFACVGGACTSSSVTANADYTVAQAFGSTMSFRYIVQAGDNIQSLKVLSLSTGLQRAYSVPSLPVNTVIPSTLSLPSLQLSTSSGPTISSVSSIMPNGVYSTGDRLVLSVVFSQNVLVKGSPVLELNSRGQAVYLSGNLSSVLNFQYKILAGENTVHLDCNSAFSLRLVNSGIFYKDATTQALTPAIVSLPVGAGSTSSLFTQSTISIDENSPSIVALTSTKASGLYGFGEVIDFTVQFSYPVLVSGTPSFTLTSGGTAYFTFSGARQIIDIGTEASIPITSGQYVISYSGALTGCINFNDPAMLQAQLLTIPAIAAIGITSVSATAYGMGARMFINFATSNIHAAPKALVPLQIPQCLPLIAGQNDDNLVRQGLDNYVTFRYTVGAADATLNLDKASAAISLNGGLVQRRSRTPSINAQLTLPNVATLNVQVNGAAPTILQVNMLTSGGIYGVAYPPIPSPATAKPGQIVFTVTFSQPVVFLGTVTIAMNTGTAATFLSQINPTTFSFVYTIQTGDQTTNLEFNSPAALNGNIVTLSTSNSQPVVLTLPLLGLTGNNVIQIQSNLPAAVVGITSNHSSGVFGAGEVIDIQISFSNQVTLLSGFNKNPRLAANAPDILTVGTLTYIAWSEHVSIATSIVYVSTFDGTNYLDITTMNGVNRSPTGKADNPKLWLFKGIVYLTWDEDGIINIAQFNGNINAPTWSFVFFMGTNAKLDAISKQPRLIDYLDILFVIWTESPTSNPSLSVIRVASLDSALKWTFYDTKVQQYGLNKNSTMAAMDPTIFEFNVQLYIAWAEFNGSCNNIQMSMLALSSMTFVPIPQIGGNSPTFMTAFSPSFSTLKTSRGTLFKLHWSTYNSSAKIPLLHVATIYPQYWKEDATKEVVIGSHIKPVVCQDTTYAAWLSPRLGATQLLSGALNSSSGLLFSISQSLNHNTSNEVFSLELACMPNALGLVWTEYDGMSIKVRLQTTPYFTPLQWKEVPVDFPTLSLTSGLVAVCTNTSGSSGTLWNFELVVPVSSPYIALLNVVTMTTNRAFLQNTQNNANANLVVFPNAQDSRSLSYSNQISIDTQPPTIVDVATNTTTGTYGVGQLLYVFLTFLAPVIVLPCSDTTASPLLLYFESFTPSMDGIINHPANYVGGNGTTTLVMNYTTLPFDTFKTFDYSLRTALKVNPICTTSNVLRQSTYPSVSANLLLPQPGGGHSISRIQIAISNAAPIITTMQVRNTSGTYYPGDVLVIDVTFSLPVVVSGVPSLWLSVQPNNVVSQAVFLSGSGSSVLVFVYTVGLTDSGLMKLFDDRIETIGVHFVHGLKLNGGTIQRMATYPSTQAIVVCPAPGTPGSLDTTKAITLVSDVPTILGITTTKASGTYDVGDTVDLEIVFSGKVAVTGSPKLLLNVNSGYGYYTGGSGTTTLTFLYNIVWGDSAYPLDHLGTNALLVQQQQFANSFNPNAVATISLLSTNPILRANLTMPLTSPPPQVNAPTNLYRSGHIINIRTDGLRVLQLTTTTPNGTYAEGQVIQILVQFTRAVVVTGTPTLSLNVPTNALYTSGSQTTTLTFTYTVRAGDITPALEVASNYALTITQAQSISDGNGVPVPLTLPIAGSGRSLSDKAALKISGTAPIVLSISALSGTYAAGDTLTIAITFSVSVAVSGTAPTLALNSGRSATYSSGSGTSILLFLYTVSPGDNGVLDYASTLALTGTIRAQSTNPTTPANLLLPVPGTTGSLSATSTITLISNAPTVVAVNFVNIPYRTNVVCAAGDVIQIRIKFSSRVAVLPTISPTLTLSTRGASNAIATYIGGSQSQHLYFTYTVQTSDVAFSLDYLSPNALLGSIFLFSASPVVAANLVLPPLGLGASLSSFAQVQICNNCPRVVSVTGPPTGVYSAGQVLVLSITFSSPVLIVSGQLQIRLAMALDRFAIYSAGNGTATLQFSYTVKIGDDTYPVEVSNIYSLFGGKVVSMASPLLSASLSLPQPGAPGSLSSTSQIRIDTSAPQLLQVATTTPDGTYGPGQVIFIQITYSYPVVVTGAPTLMLALESPQTRTAIYIPWTSTPTTLQFQYTVQVGDSAFRLDYMRVCSTSMLALELEAYDTAATGLGCLPSGSALSLNGGTIKAAATTPTVDASLELPSVNPWPAMRYINQNATVLYSFKGIPNVGNYSLDPPQPQSTCLFTVEGTQMLILGNGIPNHAFPTYLQPTSYLFELPRYPSIGFNLQRPVGMVGILINGVPINNSMVPTTGDACGGAVDAMGRYMYINYPTCLPNTGLIGYMLDGYPLYSDSVSGQLDECNGQLGRDGLYRYYLNATSISTTGTFIPCFKGKIAASNMAYRYNFEEVAAITGFGVSSINLNHLQVLPADISGLWLNPTSVSVTTTAQTIVVRSTGIPQGRYGPFPNAYNPNHIKPQNYQFLLPRKTTWMPTPTTLPLGKVGVMINGVPFYNHMNSDGNSLLDVRIASHLILDMCNGYLDASGAYRYYGPPDCLLDLLGDIAGTPSPIIGYAFDGYPIYGRYDSTGALATGLDRCNGKLLPDGTYGYFVTDAPPYTIGCYRGVPIDTSVSVPVYRSLSSSSSIAISSTPPYIRDITSQRAPGTFVMGEQIDFRVIWSAPVAVTGTPLLTLSVYNNITLIPATAVYNPATSTSTVSVFIYTVGSQEYIADIGIASTTALTLPGGASILRQATIPTLPANLACPASAMSLSNRIQTADQIQVKIRGLYHSNASVLSGVLLHNGINASLFQPIADKAYAYGRPMVKKDISEPGIIDKTSGIGWDYSFVDMVFGGNLALSGIATQSTTFGPSGIAQHAIDGNRSPYYSRLSATRTSGNAAMDPSPWWQLRLIQPSTIGAIKLFKVTQEPSQFEVQVVTTSGPITTSGTFRLIFNGCTSSPISVNALAMRTDETIQTTGTSMQSLLEPCTGQLAVTRGPVQRLGGYSWSITFLETLGNLPLMTVSDVTQPTLQVAVTTLFDGTDNVWYGYQTQILNLFDTLFPCYVMVFDAMATMTFESLADALQMAVWSKRIDSGDVETTIILPRGIVGQYIRIQHQYQTLLSLAEVEVYSEYQRSFSTYSEGSPIQKAFYIDPSSVQSFAPEISFKYAFSGQSTRNQWALVLKDTSLPQTLGTLGGLSDWVLTITNTAGTTMTYYMDIAAHVQTLPKYGQLLMDIGQTGVDHLDADQNYYLDTTEAKAFLTMYYPQYPLLDSYKQYQYLQDVVNTYATYGRVPIWGEMGLQRWRPQGICEDCVLGTSHVELYNSASGALLNTLILKARGLQFRPDNSMGAGMDSFTYTIALASQESAMPGLVRIQTLECRDPTCICDVAMATNMNQGLQSTIVNY